VEVTKNDRNRPHTSVQKGSGCWVELGQLKKKFTTLKKIGLSQDTCRSKSRGVTAGNRGDIE